MADLIQNLVANPPEPWVGQYQLCRAAINVYNLFLAFPFAEHGYCCGQLCLL